MFVYVEVLIVYRAHMMKKTDRHLWFLEGVQEHEPPSNLTTHYTLLTSLRIFFPCRPFVFFWFDTSTVVRKAAKDNAGKTWKQEGWSCSKKCSFLALSFGSLSSLLVFMMEQAWISGSGGSSSKKVIWWFQVYLFASRFVFALALTELYFYLFLDELK